MVVYLGVFEDAMLSMQYQGTMYSKPACTSRLLVEQKQIPMVGNAIFFRGDIYIFICDGGTSFSCLITPSEI